MQTWILVLLVYSGDGVITTKVVKERTIENISSEAQCHELQDFYKKSDPHYVDGHCYTVVDNKPRNLI